MNDIDNPLVKTETSSDDELIIEENVLLQTPVEELKRVSTMELINSPTFSFENFLIEEEKSFEQSCDQINQMITKVFDDQQLEVNEIDFNEKKLKIRQLSTKETEERKYRIEDQNRIDYMSLEALRHNYFMNYDKMRNDSIDIIDELRENYEKDRLIERKKGLNKTLLHQNNLRDAFYIGDSNLRSEVQKHDGECMVSFFDKFNKSWAIESNAAPTVMCTQPHCIGETRTKLAKGSYVLHVSILDSLGGNSVVFEKIPIEYNGPYVTTAPVQYGGSNNNDDCHQQRYLKFNNEVLFPILPAKKQISYTSCVFLFELFQLATPITMIDVPIGWGVFPVCSADLKPIEGTFRVPLIIGAYTPSFHTYKDLDNLIKNDLDLWLANLIFSATPRPFDIHPLCKKVGSTPEITFYCDDEYFFDPDNASKPSIKRKTGTTLTTRKIRPIIDTNSTDERNRLFALNDYFKYRTRNVTDKTKRKETKNLLVTEQQRDVEVSNGVGIVLEKEMTTADVDVIGVVPDENIEDTLLDYESKKASKIKLLPDEPKPPSLNAGNGLILPKNFYSPFGQLKVNFLKDMLRNEFRELFNPSKYGWLTTLVSILLFLFVLLIRGVTHGYGQILLMYIMSLSNENTTNIWGSKVYFQLTTITLPNIILIMISGTLSILFVFLIFGCVIILSNLLIKHIHPIIWRFVLFWGIVSLLDPIVELIKDLFLSGFQDVLYYISIGSDFRLPNPPFVPQSFQLFLFYYIHEGNGVLGGLFTLLFFVVHIIVICFIIYFFMVYFYDSSKIIDTYIRMVDPEKYFFCPEDNEISYLQLKNIIANARKYKNVGINGQTITRGVITEKYSIYKVEDDDKGKSKSKHLNDDGDSSGYGYFYHIVIYYKGSSNISGVYRRFGVIIKKDVETSNRRDDVKFCRCFELSKSSRRTLFM
eukprot:TRINITY_DN2876_c0_g1_i2.p1 TRINITY_DN2876_c0_g1~~TRINITY_DN2876_c0_g1_i2.p1  ORF type:complete len:927 (+),score=187.71 TRINITY_DN2876_c0_g1_i2:914-3694(+)